MIQAHPVNHTLPFLCWYKYLDDLMRLTENLQIAKYVASWTTKGEPTTTTTKNISVSHLHSHFWDTNPKVGQATTDSGYVLVP